VENTKENTDLNMGRAKNDRWKKILEIKEYFQGKMGCSIYEVLPGVVENSMK
jgi:hypothetical protein